MKMDMQVQLMPNFKDLRSNDMYLYDVASGNTLLQGTSVKYLG